MKKKKKKYDSQKIQKKYKKIQKIQKNEICMSQMCICSINTLKKNK